MALKYAKCVGGRVSAPDPAGGVHDTLPAPIVLTYKALNGLAPPYLSSAFTLVADVPSRRRLRSASTDQLLVPRTEGVPYRWCTCLERSSL